LLPLNFILPGVRGDETKTELLDLISRLSAYNQLALDAGASSNEQELLQVAATYIPKVLFVPRASIAMANPDSRTFTVVSIGGKGDVIPQGHSVAFEGTAIGKAVAEQRTIHTIEFGIADFLDWTKLHEGMGLDQFIISPIMAAGKVLGTLNVGAPKERNLTALDVFIARQFATILGSNLRAHRNTAALEKASAAKGEFLAHMSHEIRTPMNAILGFTQLLNQDEGLGLEQKKKLHSILRAGEHLLVLINQVLEMSRIEAGQIEISSDPFHLADLVDSIAEIFQFRASSKGLEFAAGTADDLPVWILGDVGKIRQILINLLGNALRLTHMGSVKLEVRLVSAEPKLVEFSVLDTGPGISEENLERIFLDFQQVKEARGNKGTGLGLTISRRYAEKMGGAIRVESTLGVGSTFHFQMPLQLPAKTPKKRATVTRLAAPSNLTNLNKRVLVVDDDAANLAMLEELLNLTGLNVTSCQTGLEAIQRCQKHAPDLLILDHLMPGLTGMEVLKELKGNPNTSEIPVIIASASVLRDLETKAIELGAAAFVRKPIDARELFGAICDVFDLGCLESEENESDMLASFSLDEALDDLAPEVREHLLQAVHDCDFYKFQSILEPCTSTNTALAQFLLKLAEDFQWDHLGEILGTKPSG
jgi:signal transduction histidine kinase/CheY-like chemotaxis protein